MSPLSDVSEAIGRVADALFRLASHQKRLADASEQMLAIQKVNLATTQALEQALIASKQG